jgi:hypothetical protein
MASLILAINAITALIGVIDELERRGSTLTDARYYVVSPMPVGTLPYVRASSTSNRHRLSPHRVLFLARPHARYAQLQGDLDTQLLGCGIGRRGYSNPRPLEDDA